MSNFDSAIKLQLFSFPSPTIHYIVNSCTADGLKKLYKTCKYFYAKYRIWILDYLGVYQVKRLTLENYRLKIPSNYTEILSEKLSIFGKLVIDDIKVISKIAKINARHLALCCNFSINEFQKLTESGNVEVFEFLGSIFLENNEKLVLEQILEFIPKAVEIKLAPCIVAQNSMQNLLKLKRNVKIKYLFLSKINMILDAKLIAEFLKKNLDDNAYLKIEVEKQNMEFRSKLYKDIEKWNPKEKMPKNFEQLIKLHLLDEIAFDIIESIKPMKQID